jgi:hypothetical protein
MLAGLTSLISSGGRCSSRHAYLLWVPPVSCPTCAEGYLPEGTGAEREADNSFPSNAQIYEWDFKATSQYTVMVWCWIQLKTKMFAISLDPPRQYFKTGQDNFIPRDFLSIIIMPHSTTSNYCNWYSVSWYWCSWNIKPNVSANCFVFGKSRLQILAQLQAIVTQVLRSFPQSLQENVIIIPQIRSQRLPSIVLPIHCSPIMPSRNAIVLYLSDWQRR